MGTFRRGVSEPGDVVYECVRCGARITKRELDSYLSANLSIKCICGYRVFRKVRPEVVKQVAAVRGSPGTAPFAQLIL